MIEVPATIGRRRARTSLRTRLVAGTIAALALVLALFGVFVRYVVTTTLMSSVDHDLQERITQTLHRPPPPRWSNGGRPEEYDRRISQLQLPVIAREMQQTSITEVPQRATMPSKPAPSSNAAVVPLNLKSAFAPPAQGQYEPQFDLRPPRRRRRPAPPPYPGFPPYRPPHFPGQPPPYQNYNGDGQYPDQNGPPSQQGPPGGGDGQGPPGYPPPQDQLPGGPPPPDQQPPGQPNDYGGPPPQDDGGGPPNRQPGYPGQPPPPWQQPDNNQGPPAPAVQPAEPPAQPSDSVPAPEVTTPKKAAKPTLSKRLPRPDSPRKERKRSTAVLSLSVPLVRLTNRQTALTPVYQPGDMDEPPDGSPNQDDPNDGRNLPGGIYRPRRFRLDGSSLDPFNKAPAWDIRAITIAARTDKPVFTTVNSGKTALRVVTLAVKPVGGVPRWFAQAPYPLTQVNAAIDGVDRALLTLIPIALLISGLGGAFVTKNVLTRVGQMVHAAARIGAEDLSQRLPVVGNDEFAGLAETFNALLQRVDIAFQEQAKVVEQQRRFTADASHELKTPLTVIRGTTSLALTEGGILDRQATADIDAAASQMAELVQDLIYLARADAGQLGRERIDLLLIEPLQRAIDRISSIPGTPPIRFVAANEYLTVNASESELVRLFTNILGNAANHTPGDGRIIVSLSSTSKEVVVMINDSGAGIAPEHIEHLTERFYRVDSARSRGSGGSGLGLAICKGIADAHNGTLTIESTVGKGTTVTVTLPRVS